MHLLGIDLAVRRSSTVAIASTETREVTLVSLDFTGIVAVTAPLATSSRTVAAIDAPLTLPKVGYLRCVERIARKMGLRLLPPLLGGMKQLTLSGIALAEALRALGAEVIEVHPTSTAKVLGIAREDIVGVLEEVGFRIVDEPRSRDDYDALLALYTALAYASGNYFEIRCEDGSLVLPKPTSKPGVP